MQMPEIDFSALEIREIGTWPVVLRAAVISVFGILAIAAVYFFIIQSHIDALELQEAALVAKRNEFREKYNMAVNLDAYKQQMVEMNEMSKEYLKALPSSSEIPDLIDSISRLGEKNSLKFGSIKIGDAKVASGFYEQPINFVITGSYNNIGTFISDLSKLPRIVTVEDFSIKPVGSDEMDNNPGLLVMNLSTKTYWVTNQSEQQTADGSAGKTTKSNTDVTVEPATLPVNPPNNAIPSMPPPSGPKRGDVE